MITKMIKLAEQLDAQLVSGTEIERLVPIPQKGLLWYLVRAEENFIDGTLKIKVRKEDWFVLDETQLKQALFSGLVPNVIYNDKGDVMSNWRAMFGLEDRRR